MFFQYQTHCFKDSVGKSAGAQKNVIRHDDIPPDELEFRLQPSTNNLQRHPNSQRFIFDLGCTQSRTRLWTRYGVQPAACAPDVCDQLLPLPKDILEGHALSCPKF